MKFVYKIILSSNLILNILIANINSVSHNTIVFSDFTESDLNYGYKTANFTILSPLTISLDDDNSTHWQMFIEGTDLFSNSHLNLTSIEWKKSDQSISEYKPLSANKQLISSSSMTNNNFIELNFRIKVDWYTIPGLYNVPFKISFAKTREFSNKKKKIRTW